VLRIHSKTTESKIAPLADSVQLTVLLSVASVDQILTTTRCILSVDACGKVIGAGAVYLAPDPTLARRRGCILEWRTQRRDEHTSR